MNGCNPTPDKFDINCPPAPGPAFRSASSLSLPTLPFPFFPPSFCPLLRCFHRILDLFSSSLSIVLALFLSDNGGSKDEDKKDGNEEEEEAEGGEKEEAAEEEEEKGKEKRRTMNRSGVKVGRRVRNDRSCRLYPTELRVGRVDEGARVPFFTGESAASSAFG